MRRFLLCRFPALGLLLTILISVSSTSVAADVRFPGTRSKFQAFDRYDFRHEGHAAIIVAPREAADGMPWIWRARFFGHEPQLDRALLERGYHLAYIDVAGLFGAPEAVKRWDSFYAKLTQEFGFGSQPVLEGMSRGGLIIYNWAKSNSDKVRCIYGDAPVCDIKSWPGGLGSGKGSPKEWERCLAVYELDPDSVQGAMVNPIDGLETLAKAGVPVIHVVGDADEVVPVSENTEILAARFRALGGNIKVIHKPGVGHHPHSLKDPSPLVEFILGCR